MSFLYLLNKRILIKKLNLKILKFIIRLLNLILIKSFLKYLYC